ncbi:MAG: ComF family protein [Bacteroidetes bacterium]|nr:MAG: ComF family protein [Bacteroidota bacterium]
MWKSLGSLFVSQTCYGCEQALTSQERFVCLDCLSQIEQTHFHQRPRDNELYFRMAGQLPLAGATALFFYDKAGRLQRIMKALKYQQQPRLGPYLGSLLGESLPGSPFLAGIEAIIPVPLHRRKQLQRGYNQSERIARGLSQATGLPVRTDLLRRRRFTHTQARQAGHARWENVSGAFLAKGHCPAHVLLLDDMVTTGNTLIACAQALLAGPTPPQQISVASIGMARQD